VYKVLICIEGARTHPDPPIRPPPPGCAVIHCWLLAFHSVWLVGGGLLVDAACHRRSRRQTDHTRSQALFFDGAPGHVLCYSTSQMFLVPYQRDTPPPTRRQGLIGILADPGRERRSNRRAGERQAPPPKPRRGLQLWLEGNLLARMAGIRSPGCGRSADAAPDRMRRCDTCSPLPAHHVLLITVTVPPPPPLAFPAAIVPGPGRSRLTKDGEDEYGTGRATRHGVYARLTQRRETRLVAAGLSPFCGLEVVPLNRHRSMGGSAWHSPWAQGLKRKTAGGPRAIGREQIVAGGSVHPWPTANRPARVGGAGSDTAWHRVGTGDSMPRSPPLGYGLGCSTADGDITLADGVSATPGFAVWNGCGVVGDGRRTLNGPGGAEAWTFYQVHHGWPVVSSAPRGPANGCGYWKQWHDGTGFKWQPVASH
jgi:hypothetical protein